MDERESNVLFPLFVCGGLAGALLAREIRGSGLSPSEFGVLSGIAVWGPITPTELSRLVGLPPTTLSEYLTRFTTRKLVRRRRNPRDGRSYLLELTAEGRRRHGKAGEGLRTSLAAIAAHLDTSPGHVRETMLSLERALRSALVPTS